MEKAYPYAVDAIPLQFGSSQLTKVTAQFKYQRHYTINRDITGATDRPLNQKVKVVNGGTSTGPVPIEVIPFQN